MPEMMPAPRASHPQLIKVAEHTHVGEGDLSDTLIPTFRYPQLSWCKWPCRIPRDISPEERETIATNICFHTFTPHRWIMLRVICRLLRFGNYIQVPPICSDESRRWNMYLFRLCSILFLGISLSRGKERTRLPLHTSTFPGSTKNWPCQWDSITQQCQLLTHTPNQTVGPFL